MYSTKIQRPAQSDAHAGNVRCIGCGWQGKADDCTQQAEAEADVTKRNCPKCGKMIGMMRTKQER